MKKKTSVSIMNDRRWCINKKTEMKNALKPLEKNHNKQCKRQFFDNVMKKILYSLPYRAGQLAFWPYPLVGKECCVMVNISRYTALSNSGKNTFSN